MVKIVKLKVYELKFPFITILIIIMLITIHYRGVVRAFVLEGRELSSFMDRVDNHHE